MTAKCLLLGFYSSLKSVSGSVQVVASGSPDVSKSCVSLQAIHLSPSLAGSVRLSGCLQFMCQQFICLPVWLVVPSSPHVSNSCVSPCRLSFVSLSGWWCPALWMSPIHVSAIHLSPSLAGGAWPCACLQFMCLPLSPFICLPVWLVVSGSLHVSNSCVFPCGISFVSSLAGGVRLPGCLQFMCLPLLQRICLPVWLVASGYSLVSQSASNSCASP